MQIISGRIKYRILPKKESRSPKNFFPGNSFIEKFSKTGELALKSTNALYFLSFANKTIDRSPGFSYYQRFVIR